MSEFLIKAFWIIVTVILMVWTSFQLWSWFFSNGQPFVKAESNTGKSSLTVVTGTSNDNRMQDAFNINNAAPARFVQIDVMQLPFSGHVE